MAAAGEGEEERSALLSGARRLGLELGEVEAGLLLRYAELVREWNQRVNLVSRRDIGNLISGHIIDSLAGVPVLRGLLGADPVVKTVSPESQAGGPARNATAPSHPRRVMDLGSGGGLPGIPLRICLPSARFTLVESTKKKARFLETAIRELGLKGAAVVDRHSREMEKDPVHRGGYDLVTARAVAELKDLIALACPFLKAGGALVAFKSARSAEETARAVSAMRELGMELELGTAGKAYGGEKDRRLLVLIKTTQR